METVWNAGILLPYPVGRLSMAWTEVKYGPALILPVQCSSLLHAPTFTLPHEALMMKVLTLLKSLARLIHLSKQPTHHMVNSSHHKNGVMSWPLCLTALRRVDLAFVAFKSFAIVGTFNIAHAAITCHVVHVCATFCFFPHLICMFDYLPSLYCNYWATGVHRVAETMACIVITVTHQQYQMLCRLINKYNK